MANSEQEGQQLLNTRQASMNRHFSLWDVLKDSIRLPRAQRTYFLVFLATSIIPLLAIAVDNYFTHIKPAFTREQLEQRMLCENTVLQPWFQAAVKKNVTAAKQEEFYSQFVLLCSLWFESPPHVTGVFNFTDGSISGIYPVAGTKSYFQRTSLPLRGFFRLGTGSIQRLWLLWAMVAVAFGLALAAATTNKSLLSVVSSTSSAKITSPIKAQFSLPILYGMIRLFFTICLRFLLDRFLRDLVFLAMKAVNFSTSLQAVRNPKGSSMFWALVDPLKLFFLLAEPMAALERGVWGPKAIYRAILLSRGNRWKCLLLCELVIAAGMVTDLASQYSHAKLANFAGTSTVSESGNFGYVKLLNDSTASTLTRLNVSETAALPGLNTTSAQLTRTSMSAERFVALILLNWFLFIIGNPVVPMMARSVFYMKCKAFSQKQASMA